MKLLDAPKLKVGIFTIAIIGIIAYMAIRVGDNPHLLTGGQKTFFVIPDAGGLVKGSQVKMSGIPVGIIRDIKLHQGQAKIEVTVSNDSPLTASAIVRIKSQGILGDKYVDIYPGSPTDPVLANGEQILKVEDQGSLDQVIGQVSQIAEQVKVVSSNLAEAVSDNGTNKHIIGRVMLNIEKLTADISEITSDNKQQISQIVGQLNRVTKSLDDILNEPGDKGLKYRLQVAMERLDNSLKNIEEITGKINNGEGTIGRLVSDESTADKVDSTLDGIETLFGAITTLQTSLDFRSDYLTDIGGARTMVGVKLQPGIDRHYYLGIVDDPTGVVETIDRRLTTGGNSVLTTEETTFKNKIKFNLWFAKSFHDLTIRAGLIESSGGLALDYLFWNDKIQWSVELLEFSQLNVRTFVQYRFWRGLYANVGYQDLLGRAGKQSGFLGVGLLLTNDDLIVLMSSLPSP